VSCTVIAALVCLLTVLGCASQQEPSLSYADVFAPTRPAMDVLPAGLVEGRLDQRDGCIIIQAPGISHLVLWPPGFAAITLAGNSIGIISPQGEVVTQVGGRVRLSGGEIRSDDQASQLIGADIPPACRNGLYWLAGEVNPHD